jgi:hypothetical protein
MIMWLNSTKHSSRNTVCFNISTIAHSFSGNPVDAYACYVQAMEYQCKEAQKLADMYREQVIQLEDQLSKIREEGNVGKELFKVLA